MLSVLISVRTHAGLELVARPLPKCGRERGHVVSKADEIRRVFLILVSAHATWDAGVKRSACLDDV